MVVRLVEWCAEVGVPACRKSHEKHVRINELMLRYTNYRSADPEVHTGGAHCCSGTRPPATARASLPPRCQAV